MESSNKDQTDDILREKLHALEIDAPLHVFDKVQQKRRKKYSAIWLFGSAATLLLALVVLLLFTEPNKVELPANLSPEVKKESSVIEEQNVLSHSNAVNALVEEKMKVKKSKPKLSKRNVDLVYLNKTPDQAIAEEENTLVPAKEYIPIAANQTQDAQKPLRLLPKIGSAIILLDSLKEDTTLAKPNEVQQAFKPDSASLQLPSKPQKGKWHVGVAYTQNLFNTQYAKNSESLLVFGDSSQERDKPISSLRFDVYVGRMIGANWFVNAGIGMLKTQYAYITKAEQESPSLNLSISNTSRNPWQSSAAYFDESLTYISLPIDVGYQLNFGKWNLNASVGPQFNYLFKTKTYKASTNLGNAPDQIQDANNERFNTFSFAMQQKCMITYPVIPNCSVGIGVQAMQSFKNSYQLGNISDPKVYMLGLQLGIKYYLP
jgi:hypothetical protein